jgi:hypothetical protein
VFDLSVVRVPPAHPRETVQGHLVDALAPLHSPRGAFLYLDPARSLGDSEAPRVTPWVAFFNHAPRVPHWFGSEQREHRTLFDSQCWKVSLPRCLGLYAHSAYLADWLSRRVPVPVEVYDLPVPPPRSRFDMAAYLEAEVRRVVQFGWYGRRLHTLISFPSSRFVKTLCLAHLSREADRLVGAEMRLLPEGQRKPDRLDFLIEPSPGDGYERLFRSNIALLDFYDTGGDAVLSDCVLRGTPLLVNPVPAVVSLLGPDYPLYFETVREAAMKAEDDELVLSAHRHLMDLPARANLTTDHFVQRLTQGEIYRRTAS